MSAPGTVRDELVALRVAAARLRSQPFKAAAEAPELIDRLLMAALVLERRLAALEAVHQGEGCRHG